MVLHIGVILSLNVTSTRICSTTCCTT
jgi:hypothetical protein